VASKNVHDPKQGRRIRPDPSGMSAVDPTDPQTWNRYTYLGNSPLNNVDPQGLDGWDDWGGGGFGWGDFCGDFMACAGSGGGAILPGMLPNFIAPNQGIDLKTLFFGPMCSTVQDCAMGLTSGSQAFQDCLDNVGPATNAALDQFDAEHRKELLGDVLKEMANGAGEGAVEGGTAGLVTGPFDWGAPLWEQD
jgi:hypothetical protein